MTMSKIMPYAAKKRHVQQIFLLPVSVVLGVLEFGANCCPYYIKTVYRVIASKYILLPCIKLVNLT